MRFIGLSPLANTIHNKTFTDGGDVTKYIFNRLSSFKPFNESKSIYLACIFKNI